MPHPSPPATPDLSSLAALARDGSVDIRPVLLRVRTDLFLAAPSRSRDLMESFAALATALIPSVDVDTLATIARKLAPHPETPMAIIEALLSCGGEIAEIVLALSPHIPRYALTRIADEGSVSLLLALAARKGLDGLLMEQLVERNLAMVDERLARNTAAPLSAVALDTLLRRARADRLLASALSRRADLTGADKASLFAHADQDGRCVIIQDLSRLAELAARQRFRRQLLETDAAILVAAAGAGDRAGFITTLAVLLNTGTPQASALVNEPTGEVMALALVSVGMTRQDCERVFLTLDRRIARSVERVFALSDLMRRVKQPVATRIIDAILGRTSRLAERSTLIPAMAPSGTPARPGPSTAEPARQRQERITVRQMG
jgi:uncharacterized protein (DUF2336 family)